MRGLFLDSVISSIGKQMMTTALQAFIDRWGRAPEGDDMLAAFGSELALFEFLAEGCDDDPELLAVIARLREEK